MRVQRGHSLVTVRGALVDELLSLCMSKEGGSLMLPCDGYLVSRSFCLCSVVSRVLQANGVSPGDHCEKCRWVGDCTETEYFRDHFEKCRWVGDCTEIEYFCSDKGIRGFGLFPVPLMHWTCVAG